VSKSSVAQLHGFQMQDPAPYWYGKKINGKDVALHLTNGSKFGMARSGGFGGSSFWVVYIDGLYIGERTELAEAIDYAEKEAVAR